MRLQWMERRQRKPYQGPSKFLRMQNCGCRQDTFGALTHGCSRLYPEPFNRFRDCPILWIICLGLHWKAKQLDQ
eukprot:scaffold103954_cov31-Attheya_sp.AAC.1